jgi:hypothetical protein
VGERKVSGPPGLLIPYAHSEDTLLILADVPIKGVGHTVGKKTVPMFGSFGKIDLPKTSKLHNNLNIIYKILGHLSFQTSPISCDLG